MFFFTILRVTSSSNCDVKVIKLCVIVEIFTIESLEVTKTFLVYRNLNNSPDSTKTLVKICTWYLHHLATWSRQTRSIPPAPQWTTPSDRIHYGGGKGNDISFLDVAVLRWDKAFTIKVYRKPTHTGLYIHYTSHHHPSMKAGTVRNLGREQEKELQYLQAPLGRMDTQGMSLLEIWEKFLEQHLPQMKKWCLMPRNPSCYICCTWKDYQRRFK